jgi:isoquinoline 1-oxidoreductase subunit alpha
MSAITITINDQDDTVESDPAMPLLWVLRDLLGLTGTKYGCGIGACGACTVHIDGEAVRSCLAPVSSTASKQQTANRRRRDGQPAIGPGAGKCSFRRQRETCQAHPYSPLASTDIT